MEGNCYEFTCSIPRGFKIEIYDKPTTILKSRDDHNLLSCCQLHLWVPVTLYDWSWADL